MHDRRQEPTRNLGRTIRFDIVRFDRLSHHVSMLAVGLVFSVCSPVLAQNNPVVDLSDPNVSVDLSVLNDGGLAPSAGAPFPAATGAMGGASYQAPSQTPGANTPVSTLYIKPTSTFKLPPQTKAIETKMTRVESTQPEPAAPAETMPEPVPEPMQTQNAPAPVEVAETPPMAETTPKAVPETAPEPAPEPVAMATPTPPTPEPAPQPESTPEAVATLAPPPPPTVDAAPVAPTAAMPEPQDEVKPTPLVAEAPTVAPEPTPAPAAEVAALTPPQTPPQTQMKTEEVAPPPPPQAVAIPDHDETQTAPKANKMVLPVPAMGEEVASLPPATGPLVDGDSLRIPFEADSSKLPQSARDRLLSMADKMRTQEGLRLQLLAYAGNADTSASAARRLSLSRALAVRSFLIENGVRSTRIDVRALGNKSTEETTERVDITVIER